MALDVVTDFVGKAARAIFGSRNERLLRGYRENVERINALEPEFEALSDEALAGKTEEFRRRFREGETLDDLLPEAFAACREAAKRCVWLGHQEAPADLHPEIQERIRQAMQGRASLLDPDSGKPIETHGLYGMRPYDVQLIAGMVLHEGKLAELATGEGKTLCASLPTYLNCLSGRSVHIVSTNDYLVRVGREWNMPIFRRLGVSVGAIQADMDPQDRQAQYACDVVYGTNNEFGFDYLRDNMKTTAEDQVQGDLAFAIVDEADSVLIDEARTPLIISGPAFESTDMYEKADAIARQLKAGRDFEIKEKEHQCPLTEEGVRRAEELAGIGSFYVAGNMEWPHLIDQALRAHHLYRRDKNYVVKGEDVVIVDEFTGRLMPGRQWSDGLHQAVEAKEQIRIKEETQTLATITLQNYFRMYDKLAGMTATAMTEATEFDKIYQLEVVTIPTNRPLSRVGHADVVFRTLKEKLGAIVDEIKEYHDRGRPILVGTTSIEMSERLSNMLDRRYGIQHEVLNAKYHEKEAQIVALAGQRHVGRDGQEKGNVTIATNMAGRGTDIKLGPGVVWPNCFGPWDLQKQSIPSDFGHKCCVGCPEYDGGQIKSIGRRVVETVRLAAAAAVLCLGGWLVLRLLLPGQALAYLIPGAAFLILTGVAAWQVNRSRVVREPCAHCFKPKIDPDFPQRGRTECVENPPCGLHVIGTERHEARRIDNQLRGRSGRQGDPGSSRFFLSLEDDLMRIFARDWVSGALEKLGMEEGMALEHKWLSKGIENAQKKVEERNFDIRKNLLKYDEVMDQQRKIFYGRRQNILTSDDLRDFVWNLLAESVETAVEAYLDESYSLETVAEWAARNLGGQVDPVQLRGREADELADFLRGQARDWAREAIDESLGEFVPDPADYEEGERVPNPDYRSLAQWARTRLGVEVSESDLKQTPPHEIRDRLLEAAAAAIEQVDFGPIAGFLEPAFRQQALADWANQKFDLGLEAADFDDSDSGAARDLLNHRLSELYAEKERAYPVEFAIEEFLTPQVGHEEQDFESLAEWASRFYLTDVHPHDVRSRRADVVREKLLAIAREFDESGRLRATVERGVEEHRPATGADEEAEAWQPLAAWCRRTLGLEIQPDELLEASRPARAETGRDASDDEAGPEAETAEQPDAEAPTAVRNPVAAFVEGRARADRRGRMTELERYLLLQAHDTSWKDHLLTMDHLRSSVGLRGYAQKDPLVEYKREGLDSFERMLESAREKFTDLFFRARWVRQDALSRIWAGQESRHALASSAYEAQRQAALESTQRAQMADEGESTVTTIVRDHPKVGRNDPCPCGSGKKYKKCCGRRA